MAEKPIVVTVAGSPGRARVVRRPKGVRVSIAYMWASPFNFELDATNARRLVRRINDALEKR